MKSLKNYFLAFLALGFILTASCKKYPEGPLINLSSKLSRAAGLWDVVLYTVDGYDSTMFLKNQPAYGMYMLGDKKDGLELSAHYYAENPYGKFGWWEFRNKKNDIYIHFDGRYTAPVNLGPYGADDITWEIRKLTSEDLWLKTTFDNKVYYVKFKAIHV